MDIKILGSGCAKCEQLEAATRGAAEELGVRAELEKVTDPAEIDPLSGNAVLSGFPVGVELS